MEEKALTETQDAAATKPASAAATEAATVTEAAPKKERMLEQDIAKGIAILMVIALHTLKLTNEAFVVMGGLFGFIMPFFFFMAGYNHRPGRYGYKEIVKRRAGQILKPFIIYSVLISLIVTNQATLQQVLQDFATMILSRSVARQIGFGEFGTLYKAIVVFWFIQMLFTASLVFYAVADYALSKTSRFVSVAIGLTAITMVGAHFDITLPFYVVEASAIATMMLFGALFGQHKLLGKHAETRTIVVNCVAAYAIFLALALLCQGAGFMSGGDLWKKLGEWEVLLTIAFAIFGTYPFVHACRLLVKTGPLCKALSWCGNNSMLLLFLHLPVQFFVCEAMGVGFFRISPGSTEVDPSTFVVFALEMLITVLIILVINRSKEKRA